MKLPTANGIDIKNSTPQKYPLSSEPPQTAQAWASVEKMAMINPVISSALSLDVDHICRMSILQHFPVRLRGRPDPA